MACAYHKMHLRALLFAKWTLNLAHISTPIRCKQAASDVTMEAAMRPIRDAPNVSMPYRIEMNVVDVALEVRLIANGVLPIAALPNALLSFG